MNGLVVKFDLFRCHCFSCMAFQKTVHALVLFELTLTDQSNNGEYN